MRATAAWPYISLIEAGKRYPRGRICPMCGAEHAQRQSCTKFTKGGFRKITRKPICDGCGGKHFHDQPCKPANG